MFDGDGLTGGARSNGGAAFDGGGVPMFAGIADRPDASGGAVDGGGARSNGGRLARAHFRRGRFLRRTACAFRRRVLYFAPLPVQVEVRSPNGDTAHAGKLTLSPSVSGLCVPRILLTRLRTGYYLNEWKLEAMKAEKTFYAVMAVLLAAGCAQGTAAAETEETEKETTTEYVQPSRPAQNTGYQNPAYSYRTTNNGNYNS